MIPPPSPTPGPPPRPSEAPGPNPEPGTPLGPRPGPARLALSPAELDALAAELAELRADLLGSLPLEPPTGEAPPQPQEDRGHLRSGPPEAPLDPEEVLARSAHRKGSFFRLDPDPSPRTAASVPDPDPSPGDSTGFPRDPEPR